MAILELGALVLLAGVLAWTARRLGLPSLVGFLAAGVLASPLKPRLSVTHGQLLLVAALARLHGPPDVRPLQLAVGLGQMGEFSFAIAVIAADHGALPPQVFEAVPGTLVVSLAASTALARLSGPRRRLDAR